MAQEHHTDHISQQDASGFGMGMGFIVAFGTIVLLAVLAIAILFAVQPWDDDGGVAIDTPITDDTGGGDTGGGDTGEAPAP